MANFSYKAKNKPKNAADGPSEPSFARTHSAFFCGLFHLHYIFVLILRNIPRKSDRKLGAGLAKTIFDINIFYI